MNQSKKCTAIKSLLALALLWTASVHADTAIGTVQHLSGPLLAKKADGTIRVIAIKSSVEVGDTLLAQQNSYAQIKFSDNSLITLQPQTTLAIDRFSYDAAKPEAGHAAFTLSRGGVRVNAGALIKRSKDGVTMVTPAATVGLQGSALIQYREENAEAVAALRQAYLLASTAALSDASATTRSDMPPASAIQPLILAQIQLPGGLPPKSGLQPSLPPGLYVQVIDGLIHVTNPAGTQNFAAGQFGFTPNFTQPPIIVPKNPGLSFTPPPTFSSSAQPGPTTTGTTKSPTVDCEVR